MPPSPGSARQKLSTNRLRKVTDEASITIDDRQGAEPISFQDFGRVHQRRVSRDSHAIVIGSALITAVTVNLSM